jgi:hypothetical protein
MATRSTRAPSPTGYKKTRSAPQPSSRAVEKANPNARFKRTASPSTRAKKLKAQKRRTAAYKRSSRYGD